MGTSDPAGTVAEASDAAPSETACSRESLEDARVLEARLADATSRLERLERALHGQTELLRLLERVAAAVGGTRSVDEAMTTTLALVCVHTGWPVGHALVQAEPGRDELVSSGVWRLDDPRRFAPLREAREKTRFAPGAGVPGRVLASGRLLWADDVTEDPDLGALAASLGIEAACAVPVLVGSRVEAVLEFLLTDEAGVDRSHVTVLEHIGPQLGRVIEHERAGRALRESEARFRDFAEVAADFFWELDADLVVSYVSERFEEITGIRPRSILGRTRSEAFAPYMDDPAKWERGRRQMEAREPYEMEYSIGDGRGAERRIRSTGKPVFDEQGRFKGYRGTGTDVTEAYQLAQQLSYQASHDDLTDLVNRREFRRRLSRALDSARQRSAEHALCYLDLDRFKLINDTSGHVAGDDLLRQLGRLLKARVRGRDTLARLGGDEFAILMEHCSLDQAARVADSLREAIADFRFAWEGREFAVGVSIGLVPIGASSESVAAVLDAADAACYAAKSEGRNRLWVARDAHVG